MKNVLDIYCMYVEVASNVTFSIVKGFKINTITFKIKNHVKNAFNY